jgi:hypothetical protein
MHSPNVELLQRQFRSFEDLALWESILDKTNDYVNTYVENIIYRVSL